MKRQKNEKTLKQVLREKPAWLKRASNDPKFIQMSGRLALIPGAR